ncbi:32_t:CDS:2, partial [Cetraspora pellucida]
ISNLKEQLEKMLQNSINQENYINYLEKRLAIFQNEIDKLNEKILDLIQRKINNIRQYFQSPATIAPTINGIVNYLNIISDAGNRFKRLVLQIYSQANARAINAENQVANLQTQLITLQTQLANSQTQFADLQTQLTTLQNDYDLLHQAYEPHRTQHNIFKSRELNGRITIPLAQGRTAAQLGANLRHGTVGQAGNIVIPAHTVFNEDWSFANGRPTDRIVNLPNVNSGSDPVGRFYSKLHKLARLAGIDEQQIRLQFIRGISPDNQLEIRHIRINRPISELLTELEEIEKYKTEQLSGAYLYSGSDKSYRKDNNPSGQGMTKTEIENLIKSMMSSIQEMKTQHFVPSQPISSQPSQSYYRPQPPGTSQIIQDMNMSRFIQWLTGEIPEFVPVLKPDLPPKPPIKKVLQSNNLQSLEVTDNDPIKDMRKQLENLQINLTKINKAMKKNSSKPKSSHKSSSDSSDSENSTISSENELKTNTLARLYNESESDSSRTSESSNSESDELKKHKNARPEPERSLRSNKTSSKKGSKNRPEGSLLRNTKSLKIPIDNISLNAFFAILRSIVDSFTRTQPKEVSINGYNMINAEFIALKDPQTNILPKTAPEEMQPEAEISWPNPIEINFIRKIISNDVATITCQIISPSGKNIQVPGALIDSGANCSFKSKGLAKLLGMNIDKNKKPSVKWCNNSLESIGTCYNVLITFGNRNNSCTITEDFSVMDDDKPWILLGTPLLDRAGWEPIVKHEFKLIHKGKVITIPLSVYKSQREIFKPEINLTFHKHNESKTQSSASSVQVSTNSTKCQISDSSSSQSSNNNILLEKWHASAGFSPDFSLSSEDDLLQSKSLDDESEISQRLKAQLSQDFISSLNHNPDLNSAIKKNN